MTYEEYSKLQQRVMDFGALRLDGQPQIMHMGTAYLVSDLWGVVKKYYDNEHPRYADGQEGEAE